jgi:NAD(P)-dependent dehydrogenase (short-subunit alcohol dehydrogenase family)
MGLLQDKVVIVTGAGPGMNSKVGLQAAAEGAKVVLAARTTSFIDEVAQRIAAAGGEALAVTTDVGDPAACARLIDQTASRFGRIDGLVNGAYGAADFVPFEEANLDDWKRAMNVTLFGSLQLIQRALPVMKAQGGGSIVNVGTMETRKPLPAHGSYILPKSALQSATRLLALELGKYDIRVNTVLPGWMWGPPVENYMTYEAQQSGASVEQLKAAVAANIPLGRIPPDEECARAVVMFLSDYTSQVTGAALDVNGGEYMAPA